MRTLQRGRSPGDGRLRVPRAGTPRVGLLKGKTLGTQTILKMAELRPDSGQDKTVTANNQRRSPLVSATLARRSCTTLDPHPILNATMSTPKQIAASRANGARSKGPVTAQGKLNSSRNSTRHGLFAQTIVLEDEKKEEFFTLLNELLDEHKPGTPTETMLVEAIAAARWRQDRIWGMQKVAFDHDVSSSPTPSAVPPLRAVLSLHSSPERVRTHELLLRYDIAFDRQISRVLLRLQQLQDRNKRSECPAEPKPEPATPHSPSSGTGKTTTSEPEPASPEHPTESVCAERTQQPVQRKRPAPARTQSEPARLLAHARAKAIHFAGYFLRKFMACVANASSTWKTEPLNGSAA
jgi:hypothetical protein